MKIGYERVIKRHGRNLAPRKTTVSLLLKALALIVCVLAIIVLCTAIAPETQAQGTWVTCTDGEIVNVFPGPYCPAGWSPVW
jgi:hypothetical protein